MERLLRRIHQTLRQEIILKVFFTVDALINAGTEKSILDIVSHFSIDVQVTVIYFYPRHELKDAYEAAGIQLIYLDLKGKKDFKSGIQKLTALIKTEKPDIVVSSILRANIISRIACKRTKTKLVGTFVSDSYSAERQQSFSFKRKIGAHFYYLLDKFTAKIPVRWIANSESIKKSNCKYLNINPSKVEVVYRGRDKNKFPEKNNNPGKIFRFVFVGRLLETKGLLELVKAFENLNEVHPHIQLDIFGDGSFRKQITDRVAQSSVASKINLHGMVHEGWKKMYDADCFVFPSWYEGFSGSLIEAMMVGIPIIASDIPMNLEAVENNKTALVFPVKNIHALTDSMKDMMENYSVHKLMAEHARAEAFRRFDIRNISAEYEKVLKDCITNSSSGKSMVFA